MQTVTHLYCAASERSFVGCVVSGGGTALDTHPVTEEHFVEPLARRVYEAAAELYRTGAPVHLRTVMRTFAQESAELRQQVSEICFYPSPSQCGHFFEILNDKLILRRAHEAGAWAVAESQVATQPKEFCAELQTRVASLDATAASEDLLEACCDEAERKVERMLKGEMDMGIPTGVRPWDKSFGGIMPGELYALAGRPGTGKTALLEMLIQQCLLADQPVTVFEKDMSPQKLIERMACRMTGMPYWRLARGMMNEAELRNVSKGIALLKTLPLHLYNPSGLTADRLCQIARRDIRVKGVKAVFLYHIQALRVGKDLREGLTQASLTIRANVTETNVPHIILAHINRNGAKGRPAPEDIKEFDQLYGDCDGMMLLWSEQDKAELRPGEMLTTKFYSAKNRAGGPTEDEMFFDGPTMTFKEKAKDA